MEICTARQFLDFDSLESLLYFQEPECSGPFIEPHQEQRDFESVIGPCTDDWMVDDQFASVSFQFTR